MPLPLGRPGIGHRELDGAAFHAAAVELDRTARDGLAVVERCRTERSSAKTAARSLPSAWKGPEPDRIDEALRGWDFGGGSRVELAVADAYRSIEALAGVARATGEIIDRVERYERSLIEQAAATGLEWTARGIINLTDALGGSDADAQRSREVIDGYNRLIDQASAEREAALDSWLRAMETTLHAVQPATRNLQDNTVGPPPDLQPRGGLHPAEAAQSLTWRWVQATRDRLAATPGDPLDPERLARWWDQASPEERAAFASTSPEMVVVLLDRYCPDDLTGDPRYGELYGLVLEARDQEPDATPATWLARAWRRYPPVTDAVAAVRDAGNARQSELGDLRRRLAGLSGPELDAVVDQLSDDELRRVHEQMDEHWIKGGLSADERREWRQTVGTTASLDRLRRLADNGWDILGPDPRLGGADTASSDPANREFYDGLTYRPRTGPLVTDGFNPGDVDQGRIADCYLIAGLQALALRDPEVLERMITPNPNGTYTVRFADGTAEIVTPDFARSGPALAYARPGPDSDGDLWPMLMEKAYAQRYGGWDHVGSGGSQSEAIENLTGRRQDFIPTDDVRIDDLADRFHRGEILGLSTIDAPDQSREAVTSWVENDAPEPFRRPDGERLVQNHAFIVTGVDAEAGTITVVNPWYPTEGEVVLTEAELRASVGGVRVNEAP